MKLRMVILGTALGWGVAASGADFVNLDFEDYTVADSGFSAEVPGWGNLCIDPFPLEGAMFGLVTTNNESQTPWQGAAALFLGTGSLLFTNVIQVSQAGDVPTNAVRIRFVTTLAGVSATLSDVSLTASVPDELMPGVYRYTTDIQALAGQAAALTFSLGWSEYGRYQLDQIEFLNGSGAVIWPLPGPGAGICLEDFHAATLNTMQWERVQAGGQNVQSRQTNGCMGTWLNSNPEPAFDISYRYQAALRGDWDVQLDYQTLQYGGTGTVVVGLALGADFGPDGTAQASVGRLANANSAGNPRYMVDWGQGPTNETAPAATSGVFRLVRTGWEVAGYVWDAGSNNWQMVGTAEGYTDDTARVGLRFWSTGTLNGKAGLAINVDNLILRAGQTSLDGLAIKTFGLDESGAPVLAWDAAGIASSNKYVVMRATNFTDSAWTGVSGGLPDTGTETNWAGSPAGAGPNFYRLQVIRH